MKPSDELWGPKDFLRYVDRSRRWLVAKLQLPDTELGSIPHFKLLRSARFDPEEIKAWLRMGCPPAARFRELQQTNNQENHREQQ